MIYDELFTDTSGTKKEEPSTFLAEIDGVFEDGVSLIINGKATKKHYLVNMSCTYRKGDRVKVTKISGTYLVDYKIGKPI